MKKIFYAVIAVALLFATNSCKDKQSKPVISSIDSTEVDEDMADTTIYGVCGEGTSMHNLELITDAGDTLRAFIDDENPNIVKGGLLSGDRIALIGCEDAEGGMVAQQVINLTSLIGKWTSLDKNFEIVEGGEVKNNVKAEQNPWTSWKILNGKLLLNKDTFMIDNLGPDSLYIENNVGIFTFKRQE